MGRDAKKLGYAYKKNLSKEIKSKSPKMNMHSSKSLVRHYLNQKQCIFCVKIWDIILHPI